jgi:predicted MFS family arabinose efflux permease
LADLESAAAVPAAWSAREERRAVVAGVALSVVGIATFLLMPQLVEAVVSGLHYSEAEAGWMSSGVMIGSTLAAAVSGFWIRRLSWRTAAAVALAGQLAANVIALFIQAPVAFIALQAVVGFFGGSLYSLALTILSDGQRPDRNFAYSIGAQTVYQVFGLGAGPYLIRHGAGAMLLVFALLAAAGLCALGWVPTRGRAMDLGARRGRQAAAPLLLTLAGCFVFYINVGAYWTYAERIGTAAGLSVAATSAALAISVVVSIAGAVFAYALGDRRGYFLPLAASALGCVLAMALLTGAPGIVAFTASAVLYGLAWNVSMAYQYATVNLVDQSGRGVALAPALHWAGGAAGPALAALFVSGHNHDAVLAIVTLAAAVSLGFFAFALRDRPRAAP